MHLVSRFFGCFLAIFLWVDAAQAGQPPGSGSWIQGAETKTRLIAARSGLDSMGQGQIGVQFRIQQGWHIYWRSPGEAGIPPVFDWSGSTNLASVEIAWPAPQRLIEHGLESFVYKDQVVLPIQVRAIEKDKPISLHLKINYGVCREICIPEESMLALDIGSSKTSEKTSFAALISRYQKQVPVLKNTNLSLYEMRGNEVTFAAKQAFDHPFLIVEQANGAARGLLPLHFGRQRRLVTFLLKSQDDKENVGLLLVDRNGALERPYRK